MSARSILPIAMLVFGVACSGDGPDAGSEDTWVGTTTTEGDVTTVINESGSVWGGTATLEEELSIGVEAGADEYMFGRIGAVYATDDAIYVLDSQVPAVRVYDHEGAFVRTLGGEGQGPGEYTSPSLMTVDDAGRVFVLDSRLARINMYGPAGEILDPWPMTDSRCCVWPMYPLTGEAVWVPVQEWTDNRTDRRFGIQAVGPSGRYGEVMWIPEIEFEQSTFRLREGSDAVTPFSDWLVWNPAPYGRLLVGTTDRYRFEVHETDGSTLVVQRYWEPVPVPAEHKEWERRRTIAFHRAYNNPEATMNVEEIPDRKPAYWSLIPSLSGETWVTRPGASHRLSDCAEDPLAEGHPAGSERPCWTDERIVDVFGADGRYRGEVEAPEGIQAAALTFFVDGDRIVTVVQDDDGVYRVKRYRLVQPNEAAGESQ